MTGFTIDDALLTRMAARTDAVVPEGELVFFGIRGLLPLDLSGTPFAAAHRVRLTDVDHLRMRCTLGQWNRANGTIALFPGSTVPARPAIATARAANGIGANMLMLGRYRYQKGIHKADSPRGHRAFRQAMFFPVWRTRDDLDYDLADDIDLGAGADSFVFDNLHCAFCDNVDLPKFSSNGCQVVSGAPRAAYRNDAPETGPWARFIANAYDGAPAQSTFTYLLFSGTEAAAADNAAGALVRSLRFGSSGDQVLRVQQALRAAGFDFLEADGGYGRDTLRAVMAFQRRTFGPGSIDGVVGPNTATALGLDWPSVARRAPVGDDDAAAIPPDWVAAAVAITPGFEVQNDPYKGVSGDFDGMGISCGALQWNIGQGSLQPMVIAAGEQHVCATMPQRGAELWRACTAQVRDGLQIVRQWQPGGRLPAATRTELATLMASAPVRRQQDQRIAAVAARAFTAATRWATSAGRAAASKREFLWFFDLVTQNGGLDGIDYGDVRSFVQLNGEGKADDVICDFLAARSGNSGHVKDAARNAQAWRDHATDDRMELLVLSYLRSGTADPRWRHVVLNRKGTIAMGHGWVNGAEHDFSRLEI